MVLLSVLLPLLASDASAHEKLLQECESRGLLHDVDLLFTSLPLSAALEAIKPRVGSFLAAEGISGDLLYKATTEAVTQDEKIVPFGVRELDDKLLSGGFQLGEIVEVVGTSGAGKTFLALTTVLRYLRRHPHSFALWLDTTGSFSAERGSAILQKLDEEADNEVVQNQRESQGAVYGAAVPGVSNALDRLIVAKAFDLQTAIQAIQNITRDGFPGPPSSPSLEEKKVDASEMMATDDDDSPNKEASNARQSGVPNLEPSDGVATMKLRFIVIDSVTVLFKSILSGVTAEATLPALVIVTNTITGAAATPQGHSSLSVFPLEPGQSDTKPSLGPTFTYLCDATIALRAVESVFRPHLRGAIQEGEMQRIVEIWRSRRTPSKRWTVFRFDGVKLMQ